MSEDWKKVAELKPYDTTYKVTDLTENVGYYFAVTAKNEAGFGEACETDALIKPKKPEGEYGCISYIHYTYYTFPINYHLLNFLSKLPCIALFI